MDINLAYLLVQVFDNDKADKALEYFEKIAKKGFPNYDNIYRHYSASGKIEQINYIRKQIALAKLTIEKFKAKKDKESK